MDRHTKAIRNDIGRLAEDGRAMVAATADVAGEGVSEARQRLITRGLMVRLFSARFRVIA